MFRFGDKYESYKIYPDNCVTLVDVNNDIFVFEKTRHNGNHMYRNTRTNGFISSHEAPIAGKKIYFYSELFAKN